MSHGKDIERKLYKKSRFLGVLLSLKKAIFGTLVEFYFWLVKIGLDYIKLMKEHMQVGKELVGRKGN